MNSTPAQLDHRYEEQARLLKVLTHPARLAILNLLRDGEHCVCHLEAHLGLRQAYISQQLAVLRDAGLIADRRDGWNVYYRVIEVGIFHVLAAAEHMLVSTNVLPTVEATVDCPCPHCTHKNTQQNSQEVSSC